MLSISEKCTILLNFSAYCDIIATTKSRYFIRFFQNSIWVTVALSSHKAHDFD